jgi:hypothetical protein
MRKAVSLIILVVTLFISNHGYSQDMGVSFSFFFPKNGYFSAPISPFSLRGIGFNLTNNIAIETGASVYRMSGMNITEIPFESKEPMVGPFFNVLVPLELVLQFGNQYFEFRLKGGGFAFYNFGTKLNTGNIDRALAEQLSWEVVNTDFEFDNKIGLGYEFGAEYIQYINNQFGISIGANYFIGGSDLNLRGNYSGGSTSLGITTQDVEYTTSQLDYTGLEISIGVILMGR